jgi:hypothetical protein
MTHKEAEKLPKEGTVLPEWGGFCFITTETKILFKD